MPIAIGIHLGAALLALPLGIVMLVRPKGTPSHKMLGRVWVGLMLVVAIGSFWIHGIREGAGPSLIHILSAWTLVAVAMAIVSIRRGKVRSHRGWMIGSFCGLIGAGVGALAPGRMIATFLFG